MTAWDFAYHLCRLIAFSYNPRKFGALENQNNWTLPILAYSVHSCTFAIGSEWCNHKMIARIRSILQNSRWPGQYSWPCVWCQGWNPRHVQGWMEALTFPKGCVPDLISCLAGMCMLCLGYSVLKQDKATMRRSYGKHEQARNTVAWCIAMAILSIILIGQLQCNISPTSNGMLCACTEKLHV